MFQGEGSWISIILKMLFGPNHSEEVWYNLRIGSPELSDVECRKILEIRF